MKQMLEANTLLKAFELICAHGVRQGKAWQLDGLRAWSEYGGNRVVVMNDTVKISVNFHNTLQLDYQHSEQLETFLADLGTLQMRYAHKAFNNG